MTDTNTAPASETTNGTATPEPAPVGPSALVICRQEYEKNGGKPNLKAAKQALAAMQAANARAETLEAQVAAAKAESYAAARALAVATGAIEFKLGGIVYTPSSRGDKVFYKVPAKKEVLDLG